MSEQANTSSGYTPKWRAAANPCHRCGKSYGGYNTRQVQQKYCSRHCANRAPRPRKVREPGFRRCRSCKDVLPFSQFHEMGAGKLSLACRRCYTPPRRRGQPLKAPKPCPHCKQDFLVDAPPSRVRLRKYCSPACQTAAMTLERRNCVTCNKIRPTDDFDWLPCGKTRTTSCRQCHEARQTLKESGLGYFTSFNNAVRQAKSTAAHLKVPFTLPHEEAKALYGSPCSLCGGPGCVLRSLFPELGFMSGGVDILCWVCGRWSNYRGGGLSQRDIVEHARSIVRHHERS